MTESDSPQKKKAKKDFDISFIESMLETENSSENIKVVCSSLPTISLLSIYRGFVMGKDKDCFVTKPRQILRSGQQKPSQGSLLIDAVFLQYLLVQYFIQLLSLIVFPKAYFHM